MRGIYILCEGQTEREFVNKILIPYFNSHQIYDVWPILRNKILFGGTNFMW